MHFVYLREWESISPDICIREDGMGAFYVRSALKSSPTGFTRIGLINLNVALAGMIFREARSSDLPYRFIYGFGSAYPGKGYGSLLMREFLRWNEENGNYCIRLHSDKKAVQFYMKHGFVNEGLNAHNYMIRLPVGD